MDQILFFESVKHKKMKEATITFDCDCQLIYSPIAQEVFVNPCPTHGEALDAL